MTKTKDVDRVKKIISILKKEYPGAKTPLKHKNPLQLLVATILSAQCTDERVNMVTPVLFAKYKSAKDFADAKPAALEEMIRSTGFFKNKTKSIIGCCKSLLEIHGGKVPVHRLDKETTGLMVFALSKEGEKLILQFKKHSVERSYFAIVNGAVNKEAGLIEHAIKKGNFGYGKKAGIARRGEGARARTKYVVKERYQNATLLRLDMKTGRTHQARVHLAAIGYPIVGDRVYGSGEDMPFGRQALHSCLLFFTHPGSGKKMKFNLDLPEDMARLVDELRGS